jgi:prohibitin 2
MLDKLLDIITVVAWIWYVLFIIFLAIKGYQTNGIKGALEGIISVRFIVALIVVLMVSLLSVSLVFIEPQEVGVVVSMVSPQGYREQPFRSGLHMIIPLAERVVIYPIYWQSYTMASEPLEGNKVGNDAIAARTSDGQSVYIDCSVIFRIDANDVIQINIDFQERYIQDYIRPILRGIVRTEVSQFTAEEVNSSKRKNLEANLQELLRVALGEKGFILDRFLLRNVAFSPEYASAIEGKQVAEQQQMQREYQAEQIRKLAEGTRDKYKIEAQGRADAIVIEAEAEASAIRVKAQAEADALRLISEALNKDKDLLTYRYIEKLSPGIRVMLVPNDNPYILPLPDLTGELELQPTLPSDLYTETYPITDTIIPTMTLTDTETITSTVQP